MSTQGDIAYRVRDVFLAEDDGYFYTAATTHPQSTVYQIDKVSGRRKVLGPRDKVTIPVKRDV
jgi:hypothetical protein